MTIHSLVLRSLRYYWRTNVAVVLGVATAVAVLSGALLVGDSVRGSLRALVLERLGKTERVVLSTSFFREELAADIGTDATFGNGGIVPIVLAQGFVSIQTGEARAGKVAIYGVDQRFWDFHGVSVQGPVDREALLSPALAEELAVQQAATILIRMQHPSDIPMESLHGRKDDAVRTVRASVRDVLPRSSLGEFSLQAQQGAVRAVYLPLKLVQRELGVDGRVNALLISTGEGAAPVDDLIRRHFTLRDLGLELRLIRNAAVLESATGLLDTVTAEQAEAIASETGLKTQPLFTYLANTLRVGNRTIPYSVVTGSDLAQVTGEAPRPIVLNTWAARELNARPGDALTMDYFLWEEPGQLVTRSASFQVAGSVPIETGDTDMTPVYPGITDASTLRDWNPPFPVDLKRIRPVDEEYWDRYTTTPKAFIPIQVAQELWRSRYGAMTSIRFVPVDGSVSSALLPELQTRLKARIDPLSSGLVVQNVRAQSLDAARGTTNFGEYFLYFSFFLVISAILLAALFFKLSVEQRVREVGLLRAVGLSPAAVRKAFLEEGFYLSILGALLGAVGGTLYASAILAALRTWWIGAIGTTTITLHLSPLSLLLGVVGGVVSSLLCIALTLRSLRRVSERTLLSGQITESTGTKGSAKLSRIAAVGLGVVGLTMLAAGMIGALNSTAAFFGSGLILLTAVVFYSHYYLSKPSRVILGAGPMPVSGLGLRNASFRPARSVVALATIASATFILISVDSFRKGQPGAGVGGYAVFTETLVPIVHDPNTEEGREVLGLMDLNRDIRFESFRVRPGDDASCLNLYEPTNPRILSPSEKFIEAGGFVFRSSLASSSEERANPWLLLNREEADGAIPVIADANSMTYVLHRKLGEDFVIRNRGQEIRLRFVGALSDSIFQSELLMAPRNFLRLFPEQEGYSVLLAEASGDPGQTAVEIENALSPYGADATPTAARLAEFHRVENTYLSTFQMLGGLGLLLGTVGLAAVLLRSVFERRRELALLRSLGFGPAQFLVMTLTENVLLLGGGLIAGIACAVLAIAPAASAQGGSFPTFSILILLVVLLGVGILVSLVSTRVALREAVLSALRSE